MAVLFMLIFFSPWLSYFSYLSDQFHHLIYMVLPWNVKYALKMGDSNLPYLLVTDKPNLILYEV